MILRRIALSCLLVLAPVIASADDDGDRNKGSESRNIEFATRTDTGNAELDATLRAAALERCRSSTRAGSAERAACESAARHP